MDQKTVKKVVVMIDNMMKDYHAKLIKADKDNDQKTIDYYQGALHAARAIRTELGYPEQRLIK